ncbi:MAG: hypothetical protein ISS45_05520 [Candidatus Omnitrophica bacterium]|nr:hypothetical protein [Candidatus Omnitrophota bacterium]
MAIVKDKFRETKKYYLVYSELITAAKYRGTITYQEIARIIRFPLSGNWMGAQIGQLLGEISEDEVRHNRPMLSAVAVNTTGVPGTGFFWLAQQLKRLNNNSKKGRQKFWEEEKKAVYEAWKVNLKA